MSWIKTCDTTFSRQRSKATGLSALGWWSAAMCFSGAEELDGRIRRDQLEDVWRWGFRADELLWKELIGRDLADELTALDELAGELDDYVFDDDAVNEPIGVEDVDELEDEEVIDGANASFGDRVRAHLSAIVSRLRGATLAAEEVRERLIEQCVDTGIVQRPRGANARAPEAVFSLIHPDGRPYKAEDGGHQLSAQTWAKRRSQDAARKRASRGRASDTGRLGDAIRSSVAASLMADDASFPGEKEPSQTSKIARDLSVSVPDAAEDAAADAAADPTDAQGGILGDPGDRLASGEPVSQGPPSAAGESLASGEPSSSLFTEPDLTHNGREAVPQKELDEIQVALRASAALGPLSPPLPGSTVSRLALVLAIRGRELGKTHAGVLEAVRKTDRAGRFYLPLDDGADRPRYLIRDPEAWLYRVLLREVDDAPTDNGWLSERQHAERKTAEAAYFAARAARRASPDFAERLDAHERQVAAEVAARKERAARELLRLEGTSLMRYLRRGAAGGGN